MKWLTKPCSLIPIFKSCIQVVIGKEVKNYIGMNLSPTLNKLIFLGDTNDSGKYQTVK